MATATWKGTVIAESDDTVVVEGNHYFPMSSVRTDLLTSTDTTSVCPWKGTATYFSVWTYREPKEAAEEIRDRVAFWKGVEVRA
jgi:uncharacterized protein (DUF427 family)